MSDLTPMDWEPNFQPTRTEAVTTDNQTTTSPQHVDQPAERRDSLTGSHQSTDSVADSTTDDEHARRVRTSTLPYWCHQCQTDITPMRMPHPMCPTCNSEFVEEIENDNHPEEFGADVDTGDETDEFEEIYNELTEAERQSNNRRGGAELRFVMGGPAGIRIGTSNDIAGGDALMGTIQNFLQAANGGDGPRPQSDPSNNNGAGAQTGGTAPANTQIPNANNLMSGDNLLATLLGQAFGAAMQGVGGGGAADGGVGGAPFIFSSLFNMVGNPGDYVFGQSGLDNIITALMEQQQSRNAPPPAPEEVINTLPRQKIREAEVAAGYECAVCKDEYSIDDMCIQLPCKHTFHDDCIRPWLHVNGTCPTCRFSLINSSPASTEDFTSSQPAPTAPSTASDLPQDPLE